MLSVCVVPYFIFACRNSNTSAVVESTKDIRKLVRFRRNTGCAILSTEEDRVIIQSERVRAMQIRHAAVLARQQVGP